MVGPVCIITGAGSGFGRAAALKLAALGWRLVLVGRTASKLEAVKREIESCGGVALVQPCDVGDYAATRRVAQATLKAFGRIDALVNNAGSNFKNLTTLTIRPEEAEEVARVHFLGPIFFTQAVLPAMLRQASGTIINVSSRGATHPGPIAGPAYCGAKAALINFTHHFNAELKNTGLRACAIVPGEGDTPILETRWVVPDAAARATMMAAEDVGDAIVLAATLPSRAVIEELHIRPTLQRDMSAEIPPPPGTGPEAPSSPAWTIL